MRERPRMSFGNPPVAFRWLPRAVVIGLAPCGRAYWHRGSQARTSNLHPVLQQRGTPSARWHQKSELLSGCQPS